MKKVSHLNRRASVISLLAVLISFSLSFYYQDKLPARIITHWNINGQPDGYSSRTFGLFLFPVMITLMSVVYLIIPEIDPLKKNIDKFWNYFEGFIAIIFTFMIYLQFLVIRWNIKADLNITRYLSPAFFVLFYYAGILIEKSKRNWFIGIRTPWTLSSDIVWKKTHKLGGKIFKIASFTFLVGIIWPEGFFWLIMTTALSASLIPLVYSYLEYKKVK